MPATRTEGAIHHRPQPVPVARMPATRHRAGLFNNESSSPGPSGDDLDNSAPLIPKASTSTLSRSRPAKQPHPSPRRKSPFVPPPNEEIIEISSDEESSPARPSQIPPAVLAEHRREISRMRAEMSRAKKEKAKIEAEMESVKTNMKDLLAAKSKALEDTKKKLADAQAAAAVKAKSGGSGSFDASLLDEQLECDICTRRLWSPYVIPDCGHTFCESCLIEWFGVTHAQFLQDNPVNPVQHELVYILDQISRAPGLMNAPNLVNLIRARLPPTPKYTCPSCRGPVTTRPVEDYSLKQVVHKVAEALGEKPPQPKNLGRNKGKSTVGGVWDGFFPPIPKS